MGTPQVGWEGNDGDSSGGGVMMGIPQVGWEGDDGHSSGGVGG